MSGGIKLTDALLDRAKLLQIEAYRLDNIASNPEISEERLAYLEVDLQTLIGSTAALNQLVNKVDITSRFIFVRMIETINQKTQEIDRTCAELEQKITSHNALVENERELGGRIDAVFEGINYLEASQEPAEILKGLEFYSKQIQDIRNANPNERLIQALSRADERLQGLKEIAELMQMQTEPAAPTRPRQTVTEKAQALLAEIRKLDESDAIPSLREIANFQGIINDIRSQTDHESVARILLQAEERLNAMKGIAELVQAEADEHFGLEGTNEIRAPQNQGNNGFIFTQNTQYAEVYDQYYIGEPYKRSACTSIAGTFILQTLQKKGPEALEDIMIQGHTTHARLMAINPPQGGMDQFAFQEIIGEHEFANLKLLDIHQNDALFENVNLNEGKHAFEDKLNILLQIQQNQQQGSPIGVVISARGESYGLVIFNNQSLVFFDSHGNRGLTGGNTAYAKEFKSAAAAAEFLAQRMPIPEVDMGFHYNTASITAVCLKNPIVQEEEVNQFNFDDNAVEQVTVPQPVRIEEARVENRGSRLLGYTKTLFDAAQALETKLEDGQNTEEAYYTAAALMTDLADKNCLFSMTNHNDPISRRNFFHVYHIHRKEAPGKLYNDMNYGEQAWQDIVRTTADERRRTVQRTLIEVAFAGLEETIAQNGNDSYKFFDMLEGLTLDAKDLPQGTKNIAHHLYGRLYQAYCKAYEANNQLLHPHDGNFRNNLGQHGFRDYVDVRISAQIKLAVIDEVRKELKQVWDV